MPLVGIKLANGEFYPILDESSVHRKRLVLTTVTDNQTGVQIDLYRSPAPDIKPARYIGTLVVENIVPQKKGGPSIEMLIDCTAEGEIVASALDLDAGAKAERKHLSVSLKSLEQAGVAGAESVPDKATGVAARARGKQTTRVDDSEIFKEAESSPQEKKSKSQSSASAISADTIIVSEGGGKAAFILILVALIALGLAALWFFAFGGKTLLGFDSPNSARTTEKPAPMPAAPVPAAKPEAKKPEAPPNVTPEPPPVTQTEPEELDIIEVEEVEVVEPVSPPPPPVAKAEEPVVKQPASERARPEPPVNRYNVPSSIPPEGLWYTIRWGDTLWAISEAFYRNPWDYRFLARYNGIRNPARIIAGNEIKIPPRY